MPQPLKRFAACAEWSIDRGSATRSDVKRASALWNANHLKCRLRLHFWTAETCLRFGFMVKSKRMVKSFAMVIEHRSQSVVVPPQSIARKN
jgi:hypothetical protein